MDDWRGQREAWLAQRKSWMWNESWSAPPFPHSRLRGHHNFLLWSIACLTCYRYFLLAELQHVIVLVEHVHGCGLPRHMASLKEGLHAQNFLDYPVRIARSPRTFESARVKCDLMVSFWTLLWAWLITCLYFTIWCYRKCMSKNFQCRLQIKITSARELQWWFVISCSRDTLNPVNHWYFNKHMTLLLVYNSWRVWVWHNLKTFELIVQHLRGHVGLEGVRKAATSSWSSNTCFVRSSFMAFNRFVWKTTLQTDWLDCIIVKHERWRTKQ